MTTPETAASDAFRPSRTTTSSAMEVYCHKIRREVDHHLHAFLQNPFLGDVTDHHVRSKPVALDAALCLAVTDICGGDVDQALGAAAALDMAHRALVLHHELIYAAPPGARVDAMDPDMPLHLNAGDGLMVLCLRPLVASPRRLGPRQTLRLVDIVERAAVQSIEGCLATYQAWRRIDDLSEEDYFQCVLRQTWWPLSRAALEAGLLIAAHEVLDQGASMTFSFFWCAAWHLGQDLRLGDAVDVSPDRPSLPLVRLFAGLDDIQKQRLRHRLHRIPDPTDALSDVTFRQLFESSECLDAARQTHHGMVGAALQALEELCRSLPPGTDIQPLQQMTRGLAVT